MQEAFWLESSLGWGWGRRHGLLASQPMRSAEASQAFHAGRQDRLLTSVATGDEAYKLWKQTDAVENAVVGQLRPSQR